MNTTKKLLVLVMVALIAAVSIMPSTFSWYSHNASNDGQKINYANDELPVSMESGKDTITMSTVKSDANGVKTTDKVEKVELNPDLSTKKAIEYYTTTFTNTGKNNVMVDLEMSNLVNDADFVIGTLSPTLNEKAYASRATKNKVTNTTTRIYFKTHPDMSSYWAEDSGTLIPETTSAAGSNSTTNDINIAYKENGAEKETMAKMTKCKYTDSSSLGNSSTKVYYFDLPSNAEYFYFFNHWYLKSSTNREWNRTIDITDTTTKGRLYYLTGSSNDKEYKEYATTPVQTNLAALNSYYDSVRMSTGSSVFADIGLKMESDEEDFVPEYYGSSIAYKVTSGTNVVSVNNDGLITPAETGTATITTTITGRFGDTIVKETTVSIPATIAQVPVLQNILVPYDGAKDADGNTISNTVDVHWYVINKGTKETQVMKTDSIFFTN